MKKNVTTINKSDLIQLDTKESNCIKMALLVNKKYKLYPNFMFSYMNVDISYLPELDIFQNLVIDSAYSTYQSITNVLNTFENHSSLSDLERSLAFLGDLTRVSHVMDRRESLYFMLAKLHLQKHKIVIVEDLCFEDDYEVQQDFIKAILSYKEEKTFFLAPQNNILSSLATKKIIQSPGVFKIQSLNNEATITNIKSIGTHHPEEVVQRLKKVA